MVSQFCFLYVDILSSYLILLQLHMSESKKRYDQLLDAIEAERSAEEKYFQELSSSKSVKERIAAGVLWYPVEITKKHYTIGEHVELELTPMTPAASKGRNSFKVGASAIFYVNRDERIEYKGAISYASRKKVRIIITADVISKDHMLNGTCGIELIYDDRPYRVMKDTVRQLMKAKEPTLQVLRDGISQQKIQHNKRYTEEQWSIPDYLNPSQQEAINQCHQVERLGIIHGPPGTGKTTTLVGLISGLAHYEKKILVTAPSNGAVDLLARRLHDAGLSVLRIGNVTRIGDSIAHLCLDEQLRSHKDWQHIKQVKIEAENARNEASKYKRKFGSQERQNRGLLYKEARQLSNWARDLEDRLTDIIMDGAKVICTTLIGCAHPSIAHLRFDTVIIDEASQALEAESWTAMVRGDRTIMAGDHRQLPPTVKSKKAEDLGLAETILDRMMDHLGESYMLDTQYRMHPAILGYSNEHFYEGKLQTADQVMERQHPLEGEPVVFIDTAGCGFDEQQNQETRSRSNKEEYFIIREHILSMGDQLEGISIGVISPYRDQVSVIRREIEQDEQIRALDIDVNSIDGFQGQEKDVIYISLVRSNDQGEIGFLKDYRRLNVALTRAKYKLIIVGDMATLGGDEKYTQLAEYVEQAGTYRSAWEFMTY